MGHYFLDSTLFPFFRFFTIQIKWGKQPLDWLLKIINFVVKYLIYFFYFNRSESELGRDFSVFVSLNKYYKKMHKKLTCNSARVRVVVSWFCAVVSFFSTRHTQSSTLYIYYIYIYIVFIYGDILYSFAG